MYRYAQSVRSNGAPHLNSWSRGPFNQTSCGSSSFLPSHTRLHSKSTHIHAIRSAFTAPCSSFSTSPFPTPFPFPPIPTSSSSGISRLPVRSHMHPDGVAVGKGRVVANYGTQLLVEELPWDGTQSIPIDGVRSSRFVCMPRGKLGKIVCGDKVLWEWSTQQADYNAFIVQLLPRQTEFRRVDKSSRGRGDNQVLLASNFHHLCIVCAAKPAANLQLVDRYLAAARRMGVSASVVFNKTDLPETSRFTADMDDFRRVGVKVFETSCAKGQQQGIQDLNKHLTTVGPNGTNGITIFVGQSGSGKSSLLNAISPSLSLRVNELSRKDQGRHTTTQTILHELDSGAEIIDSPGFQNYLPAVMTVQQMVEGFQEFAEPSKFCHFGSRCLHVNEPGCAVRLAIRSTKQLSHAASSHSKQRQISAEAESNTDPRAQMAVAFVSAEDALAAENPFDDDSQLRSRQQHGETSGDRWHKKDWLNHTKQDRHQDIEQLVNRNRELSDETSSRKRDESISDPNSNADVAARLTSRDREIFSQLRQHSLIGSISNRRYDSYLQLLGQQQELKHTKYN